MATMTNPFTKLHPDDVLFFTEVRQAMFRVAKNYHLPLKSVEPMSMPTSGMADRLGDCSHSGAIRLVMRCTVNGAWVEHPMSPDEVWDTAAHELAHLKHMNHGTAFQEFNLELREAMGGQKPDHKAKVIDRLIKMQASRQSEAELGNIGAAESFAAAINRMMTEYELNPSDIDYARATDNDPVIEVRVDNKAHGMKGKGARVAWQESLAAVVAKAHLCAILIRPGSNNIWFVGTKSHATVAEYVFGTLAPAAETISFKAYHKFNNECRASGRLSECRGYRAAWLNSFIDRVSERFQAMRDEVLAEHVARQSDAPGAQSQALVRLNGALAKTRQYIDDKFKAKKGNAAALTHSYSNNSHGRRDGRAAADSLSIGRRGISSGSNNGRLLGS